ncbi:MAG: hypothetical protein C5B58_01525 [Acidobacteria bacterium]|nr:MAG: hypothetical protein C5B58_01525 [Acidobacteriota bacterium]
MADIFNDLERIIPEERREEFLRLARELRDYGRDNPELLRLIEAIGLTSLYTESLPGRVAAAIDSRIAALGQLGAPVAEQLARTEKATSRVEQLQSTHLIVALLVAFALGIATTIAAELTLFRWIQM